MIFSPLSRLESIGAGAFDCCCVDTFEITSCVREVFGWPFVECPLVSFNFCGDNKHLVFDGCLLVSVDLKRLYCTSSVAHHVPTGYTLRLTVIETSLFDT